MDDILNLAGLDANYAAKKRPTYKIKAVLHYIPLVWKDIVAILCILLLMLSFLL
jgi:hypothetical protein